MKKRTDSNKVPKVMQVIFDNVVTLTDKFCEHHLNDDYKILARNVTSTLARKRPSPLSKGRTNVWAGAIINALGTVNFLFDKGDSLYTSTDEIAAAFNAAKSTLSNKAKQIRHALKMSQFDRQWMLPSKIKDNSLVWMITFNGFIVDARTLPAEIQEVAVQKGIIPYIYEHCDSISA